MKAILERDFVQFAKRRRYFVLRTLVFGLPLLVLLLATAAGTPRSADATGILIFMSTSWPLLFLAVFLAPGLTAPLLAEERRNNRLDVLRSAPLTVASITLGRWLSRVALLTFTLIAALPLTAASLLFGGVDPIALGAFTLLLLGSVMFMSAIGLASGAGTRDVGTAVRRAYLVVVFLSVVPMILRPFAGRGFLGSPQGLELLLYLDPFVVMGGFVVNSFMGWRNLPWTDWPLTVFLVLSLILSAVLVGWSARRAMREPTRGGAPDPATAEVAGRRARRRAIPPRAEIGSPAGEPEVDGAGRDAPTARHHRLAFSRGRNMLWQDPALWLELRRGRSRGRLRTLLLWGVILLLELGFVGALVDNPRQSAAIHPMPIAIASLLAAFAIAAAGAVAIHRDGEANVLDVLHAAPLASRTLARAKIAGALRAGRFWWGLAVIHAAVGVLLGDYPLLSALGYVIVSAVLLWALAAFAVRVGMTARNSARAAGRVLGIVVAHLFVSPVLLGMCVAASGAEQEAVALLLGHHPAWMAALPFALGMEERIFDDVEMWLPPLLYLWGYLWLALYLTLVGVPRRYEHHRAGEPNARSAMAVG